MSEEEKLTDPAQEPLFDGSEREKLYQDYQKQNGTTPEKVDEKPEEQKEPEEKPEPKEEPKKEKPEEKPEEKEEPKAEQKPKYVRLEALKEERIKRQDAQKRLIQLEDELERYKNQPKPDQTVITDYDQEILSVKQELKDLKAWKSQREQEEKEREFRDAQERVDHQFEKAARELKEEGYPGLEMLRGTLRDELIRLANEDEDNITIYDNPDGWKKVYKETIYPKAVAEFKSQEKQEHFEKKKQLKKEAGLITSPGSPEPKPDEKESKNTFEDYLKTRRSVV